MSTTDSNLTGTAFPTAPISPQIALDHRSVLEFTERLCGFKPTVDLDVDPETSEQHFVVTAPARGDVDDLVALNDRWHRELRQAVGELADQYRLSLDPQ